MFLAAYLTVCLSQLPVNARAGENKLTQLEIKQTTLAQTFDWSDTEETLRGTITPARPQANAPLTISVTLEALNSAELDGPITFAFRPLEEMGGKTQTVVRAPGQKAWSVTFTPEQPGTHRVELSWKTTHHKVVRGVIEVGDAALPKWVGYSAGGGAIVLALVIGLWLLFGRGDDPPPPTTPPTPGPESPPP